MASAGRSIAFSGVTVFAGMLLLTLFIDLLVVRSMSLAVMLVAGTGVLAGLTLLPATLMQPTALTRRWFAARAASV